MKNKGFTLIELLAVIVILAVIALIAVPIVLGIINDSRDEANKTSVEMYTKSVKNALLLHEMNGVGDTSGKYTAIDAHTIKNDKGVTLKLEYSGNEVICDNIEVSAIGDVFVSGCKVNGEEVDYKYGKTTTLKEAILSNYGGESSITIITDFSVESTGLYKADDDLGTSYYFRGNVENNYVQFGTWQKDNVKYFADGPTPEYYNTLAECENGNNHLSWGEPCVKKGIEAGTPMYWRIVRVNGDGTIRLVYDGVTLNKNGVIHDTAIKIQESYYDAEFGFIEYKDSETKKVVDDFYKNQLSTKYSEYIADSIFCNDTEKHSSNYVDMNGQYIDDPTNAWDEEIYYAGVNRVYSNKPKLTCTQDKDKYTKNKENGNALLAYPIALITADEVKMAGLGTNSYFYNGDNYFTMTPAEKFDYYGSRGTFYCTGASLISSINNLVSPITHRPVINLKADVVFTGSGTYDDPYVVVTE